MCIQIAFIPEFSMKTGSVSHAVVLLCANGTFTCPVGDVILCRMCQPDKDHGRSRLHPKPLMSQQCVTVQNLVHHPAHLAKNRASWPQSESAFPVDAAGTL